VIASDDVNEADESMLVQEGTAIANLVDAESPVVIALREWVWKVENRSILRMNLVLRPLRICIPLLGQRLAL
jgi:hypothetical protein